MIAEGLKFLVGLASKSEAPVRLDVPDPRMARYATGGEIYKIELPALPRKHEPATLAEVVALANRFAEAGAKPVVWYGENAVVLVLDDDGHRVETATLPLATSDVWDTLRDLYKSKRKYDPKEFVRLLRIDLAGTLDPVTLLNPVRKVKFTTSDDRSFESTRKKESMGREINSEVAPGGDVPENVILAAPVYQTPGETSRWPVRCAVEIDPMEGRFQLLPLPDELEKVQQMAVASIGNRLAEGLSAGVPFYAGKP